MVCDAVLLKINVVLKKSVKVAVDEPNSCDCLEMEKPGFSATFWATASIFLIGLTERARFEVFILLIYPRSSNLSINFTIAVRRRDLMVAKNVMNHVRDVFIVFVVGFPSFQCIVRVNLLVFLCQTPSNRSCMLTAEKDGKF